MTRRIFLFCFILSVLLLASFLALSTRVLALTPTPAPGANFIGTPLSGVAPLTVQFTDISNFSITSCTWDYGDGTGLTVDPTGTPFTSCPSLPHTYTTAGSFTVTMRLFLNSGSSLTATKTNYIQVSNGPTATPSCDNPTYIGHVYDALTAQGISGATVSAQLDVPRTFSTTTDASGFYTLTVPTGYGCHVTGLVAAASGYNSQTKGASLVNPNDFHLTPVSTVTPVVTNTPTRTPTTGGPTATRTRTPTIGAPTSTPTRTATPTLGSGSVCSPVTSTITAPFTFDGAGAFCWQSANLGSYINSWNTASVSLNGVNITNVYVPAGSYPAKIGGFWYVAYSSSVAWGHFEAK